jgi:tyrosine-protein phosphatase YwqE
MGSFLNFFSKKQLKDLPPLYVDMHSHLLPGLDDGSESIEDSIVLIKEFVSLGYKKLITTPHIMGDFFKNTPETIRPKLEELRKAVAAEGIDIQLEAAAEYYLDEWFLEKLQKPENLLTFGNKYLLFETSYINESSILNEAIFQIKSIGLIPVLAHPERYTYLYPDFEKCKSIYDKGALFQLNINSLSGYYSKASQELAKKLIDHEMISFVGSDCHGMRHIEALKKSRDTNYYSKVLGLTLFNNNLLE